jgi:F0F1-type ATP synthase delta subunit
MKDAEKLFSKVKTRQEAEDVVGALQGMQRSKGARKDISEKLLRQLESLGRKSGYGVLLTEFEQLFYGAKTVVLTLSFYPTEAVIDRICGWFEENLEERVIVDLIVDTDIIGGLKVMCNERFRDYSVRTKLENMGVIGKPPKPEDQVSAAI